MGFPAVPLARQLSRMGFLLVPLARQLSHMGFPSNPPRRPVVPRGLFQQSPSPASCPTWVSQESPSPASCPTWAFPGVLAHQLAQVFFSIARPPVVPHGLPSKPRRTPSYILHAMLFVELSRQAATKILFEALLPSARLYGMKNSCVSLLALCRQQAWELGGTTVSATWMELPPFGPWAGAPMLQLASFSQPYRLLLSFDLRAFLLVIVQRWAVAENPCFLWCIPAPRLVSLRPSAFASAPLVLDSDSCRSRLCRHNFAFGSRRGRTNYAGVGELRRVFSSVSRGDSRFFLLMTESGSVVVTDFGIATYVCNLEGVARTWC